MSKLRLMKAGHGDLCLAEWDAADTATIDSARIAFSENLTAGRMAFRMDSLRPGYSEPLKEFDPWAEEILIVPAIQGG